MWIERDYSNKIKEAVKTRPVVLLTGVRQAGKSSLLQRLLTDAEYVTLDRIILAEEAEENPTLFLNRFKNQVIIDEIQYAPSLFRDLKIMVDEKRNIKGKWILTGSQQFTLMRHVGESLAGRVRILNLGTLSARELNRTILLKNKRDLLWKGGYPELWAEKLDAKEFFEDYIQTYLERDLKQILNVTNLRDFRRFLSLLAIRVGQLLNYSEISKEVGVAVNTIKAWVNALEVSGLIILLPPYYNNLGKRLIKAPKLFFCDNGLLTALLNIDSLDTLEKSLHLGNIWENFVLSEHLKEGFVAGKDIFYFRDTNGVEIDFVIEKKGEVFLVEAKHSERPHPAKLNFRKIAPLFNEKVSSMVACGVEEKGLIALKDYSLYNPLNGSIL
ncbi:MAG: ATP-binding protein [Bacteroidota bacterium]